MLMINKLKLHPLSFTFAALTLTACVQQSTFQQSTKKSIESSFNAKEAWDEYETTLRLFYAYLERDDFNVDLVLERTEELAQEAKSKEEFRRILHQSTYAFTDPHLIIGPLEDTDFNIVPTSSDLQIEHIDGQFFVKDVRKGSAADKANIRPGWEILSADGVKMSDAVKLPAGKILQNLTPNQLDYTSTVVANGYRTKNRELVFRSKDKQVATQLPSPREYAITVSQGPLLETSRIDNIGVIRINNALGNNDLIPAFDTAMKKLIDCDALIIDLRNTPSGGNTEVGRSIIGHFIQDTRAYQIHEIPSLEREFSVPRRFIEQVKPRAPYFPSDKIAVLGGYWTGSMGEGIFIGLDAAADAYTIGSDLGDLLGGLSNFNLHLSGVKLDLGTESLFHVNGTPREEFIADLPLDQADRTPSGEDPALLAAIEYLAKK